METSGRGHTLSEIPRALHYKPPLPGLAVCSQSLTLFSTKDDLGFRGRLDCNLWGATVENLEGDTCPDIDDLYYKVDRTTTFDSTSPLTSPVKIRASPYFIRVGRSTLADDIEPTMYPPSTSKWFERENIGGLDVYNILQKECDRETTWMTQISFENSRTIFQHPLRDYELLEALTEGLAWTLHKAIPPSHPIRLSERNFVESHLSATPPSWEHLYALTDGHDVPDLKMGRNMYETVSQLVPKEWPKDSRMDAIIGLAVALNPHLMDIDPMDLAFYLHPHRFAYYVAEFVIHERLRGKEQFELVRMFNKPKIDDNVAYSRFDRIGIFRVQKEIRGQLKDENTIPVLNKYARELSDSQSFSVELPVTREMALKSDQTRQERRILISNGFGFTGRVNVNRLGLRSLVYLGGAYRWPHKHTTWQASLQQGERQLQIQEMFTTPETAEKITRLLERTLMTQWYTRIANFHPYDNENKRWNYDVEDFHTNVRKKISQKKLNKDFQLGSSGDVWIPDRLDVRIMDSLSSIGFEELETTRIYEYLGCTPKEYEKRARSIIEAGILRLDYLFAPRDVISRCIFLQGNMPTIRAVVYSLLKIAPSCSVYLFEDSAFLMVSMHSEQMFQTLDCLMELSKESELMVEVYSVLSHAGYRNFQFERLLKEDGTWDDDISGLLCQGSGLREVSE